MARSIRIGSLPYAEEGSRLFEAVAHWPWSVFLDSGPAGRRHGRYDIIAANPVAVLMTRGRLTEIRRERESLLSSADPLELLGRELGETVETPDFLPLAGGCLGYFAYDLAHRLDGRRSVASAGEGLPEMAVGIYDWVVVIDHQERQAWLASQGQSNETTHMWPELIALFSRPPADKRHRRHRLRVAPGLRSNLDESAYRRCFDRMMGYLQAGDCRQVTLSRRFDVSVSGDPWNGYKRLRKLNPAAFGAFLRLPDCTVLSNSPERFLRVHEGRVEASPVGAARSRSVDALSDADLMRRLLSDTREQAASDALVELMQQDLNRFCRDGTVRVLERHRLESSAHVHHLINRLGGELDTPYNALDALRVCFPGASTTGTPRQQAMQIIDEVEPCGRGICSGAIGYLGGNGHMDLNVAIHTLVHARGKLQFSAAGNITGDSAPADSYAETTERADNLMQLLTLREVGHARD